MIRGIESTRQVFIGGRELLPDRSQKVHNHSPDGFAWGYSGSGPAQLALAILIEYTEDWNDAIRLHQQFKNDIIAGLKGDFELDENAVKVWLSGKGVEAFVPCTVCGNKTSMLSTGFCDTCWELRTRIGANLEQAKEIIKLIEEEKVE